MTSLVNGRSPCGPSVKDCKDCGKQGRIYDSRHGVEYVRRLYRCECGNKWSTVEFFLEAGAAVDPHKVKRYLKRHQLDTARRSSIVKRAISALQELL